MQINDTNGSARIGVDPRFGASRPAAAVSAQPVAEQFDSVYLSAEARRAAEIEPMPASLWGEIQQADALADALSARGQEIRFDRSKETGRIVAALYDASGTQLQSLALTDLVPDPYAGEATAG